MAFNSYGGVLFGQGYAEPSNRRQYKIGGIVYTVSRFENWHDDETHIDLLLHGPGDKIPEAYDSHEDAWNSSSASPSIGHIHRYETSEEDDNGERSSWPSMREVMLTLVAAKRYAPTPRERVDLDLMKARSLWKRSEQALRYATQDAIRQRALVETAVRDATERAERAEQAKATAQERLMAASSEVARLERELSSPNLPLA